MSRAIYLVARRELQLKVKSKVIVISFAILLAIASASPWISRLGDSAELSYKVSTFGFSPAEVEEIITAEEAIDVLDKVRFSFTPVLSAEEGERVVKAAESDILINRTSTGIKIFTEAELREEPLLNLKSVFNQLALKRFLTETGITYQQFNAYLSDNEPTISTFDESAEPIDFAVALFAIVLLYMIISLSGGFLALTIIEEKSGRVIEVLLSSISARQLLLGKILGVLTFSLIQFTFVVSTWLISSQLAGSTAVEGITASQLVFYLLWFLPAVISFSFIYGGLGALISRSEDAGAIQGPMSILLIASVYGATYSLSNPSAQFVDIFIVMPPFSFFMAPAEYLVTGEITIQLIISYCAALLFTISVLHLALSLFEGNVLNNRRFTLKSLRSILQKKLQFTATVN